MMESFALRPEPRHECPLCGGPNGCVPAARGSFDEPCWCTNASFASDLLARVPEAQRGHSCICAGCAKPKPSAPV